MLKRVNYFTIIIISSRKSYDKILVMSNKVIILILAASLVLNSFFVYRFFETNDDQVLLQERYPYLSKRIFASNPNDIIVNFIPLREALKEYVGKQAGKVGVYFEYLPSGTSIGINDKEEIKLASLSKVPIAMSILKKIEREQMSLNDTLVIEKKHLNQKFGTLWKKGEGASLSVGEAIRYALVESDNTAYDLLFDQLTGKEINEVYEGLDIPIGIEKEEDLYPIVSPKNYSSIFRSLYLSSFLSTEHSNYILKLLTQSEFNDKLRAGVPENILVSHKIGVFTRTDNSRNVFIDCGIIYVPERPYIICAFVQDTENRAQKHISYISKIIYGYITKVKGGK